MDIFKIKGIVKEYDWGNKDFIASLLQSDKTDKRQAEIWFGTHDAGVALLENGRKLTDLIKDDPEKYLGPDCIERYSANGLPYLLKVLAIEKPLSIQCHPNKEQAELGWKEEGAKRKTLVRRDELNYKDDNQKAEVLYALSSVTAMAGFRDFNKIISFFRQLFPISFKENLSEAKNIQELFYTLYTLEKQKLVEMIDEYISSLVNNEDVEKKGEFFTEKGIVLNSYKEYKEDPGLFMPFMLNRIELNPGEAIYLKPTVLHAYIYGNGIELMSNSDNVLRGGLTHKKVDVEELVKIMTKQSTQVAKSSQIKDEFERRLVITPCKDFALYSLKFNDYEIREQSPSLLLVTQGKVKIRVKGEHIILAKGECAFIPYSVDEYSMKVEGIAFFAKIG